MLLASALVPARCVRGADKAHNARDQMLDARRDPTSCDRFKAGVDGTAWYQLRIHQILKRRLPDSRSTELLGEALQELLASQVYRQVVPEGIAPAMPQGQSTTYAG